MIAKTPVERELYEDRRKAERDQWAAKQAAREEGREEGVLIGKIELLCELLSEPWAGSPLREMERGDLVELETGLSRRLRERKA